MKSQAKRRVLTVIMDGVGVRKERFGNAVALARKPNLDFLGKNALYTTLFAHGTYVGMPSNSDIGNSEVGHNALGAGRIFDQGAKLVQNAIDNGNLFRGRCWLDLIQYVKKSHGTLHFLGLLSDGNVHSHEQHLYAMMRRAKIDGISRVRIHVLFDGRDVAEKSAEIYAARLQAVIAELKTKDFDVAVASGGGRMNVTMDRYEADWSIVERGWHAHVLADSPRRFPSLDAALKAFREDDTLTDQYFPPFVIEDGGKAAGPIVDGDGVVFYNFRGDRAIEICKAFSEADFKPFRRERLPKVFFAGMMEYDGDYHIPQHYLVSPPVIDDTLTEYLLKYGVKQFACSETQKYGHVTYFWNGNRSGKMDDKLEIYQEIPSDRIEFDLKPEMKAEEIAQVTIQHMQKHDFDFGRINFANGDMVGHTGNLKAAVKAVEVVDTEIGKLIAACKNTDTILMVTADHGNCDEMFDAKEKDFPNWETCEGNSCPKPKTAHTLAPVPLYIFDPRGQAHMHLRSEPVRTLSNLANTTLDLLGIPENPHYLPSLITLD